MRRLVCYSLLGILLLGHALSAASAPSYAFTAFDVPGIGGVLGINSVDQMVGLLNDATGSHGFLFSAGTVTLLDVPGSGATAAEGINNAGDIVGFYGTSYQRKQIAFLFSGGTFTTIEPPGSVASVAYGINNTGQIVGEFGDGQARHEFLLSEGRFVTIDPPNSIDTQLFGINDAGEIVGAFSTVPNMAPQHGFLLSGGAFTILDAPGASDFTRPRTINNAGQIVGEYGDVNHNDHGFVFSAGTFSTIDPPGSVFTTLSGINDNGQIVGRWTGNVVGGGLFVASPAAVVNDLVTLDSVATRYYSPLENPFSDDPAGAFEIIGRFRNSSAHTICSPFIDVAELSGGNRLIGAFALTDDGEQIPVLNVPSRPPVVFETGATIPFQFMIGLQTLQQFNFLVNMNGASPSVGGRCP